MAMNDPYDNDRDRLGNVPPNTRPADIPVERRDAAAPVVTETAHRSSPLKWLIPLLLLLVIGFALTRNRRTEPEVAAVDPSSTQTTAATGEVAAPAAGAAAVGATGSNAVQAFVTWANQGGNNALPQESEDNHPYTTQGLRLLADALGAASTGRGGDYTQRVQNIRAQAERLQTSSDNDQHAEYAHAAFRDAAVLIGELRGSAANELTQSANAIQPALPLSPQGNEVRAFFRQAATALQQLPAATGGM
jgi:hypothetical protein